MSPSAMPLTPTISRCVLQGTWAQATGTCTFVDDKLNYWPTASGVPYDCICQLKSAPTEWAPALSCVDGGGAAIRGSDMVAPLPPACRARDGDTYQL